MAQSISDTLKFVNSIPRIPTFSRLLNNGLMQTIDQIRRDRLAILIEAAGSQAKLAGKINKSVAQIDLSARRARAFCCSHVKLAFRY